MNRNVAPDSPHKTAQSNTADRAARVDLDALLKGANAKKGEVANMAIKQGRAVEKKAPTEAVPEASETRQETKKTTKPEVDTPEAREQTRSEGVSEPTQAPEQTSIDPALKQELLGMVPASDRHFLAAMLKRIEQRGISLRYAQEGLGNYYNVGENTLYIDPKQLEAAPEHAVWQVHHIYLHAIRTKISPRNFSSAEAYAARMEREELDLIFIGIEKKLSLEKKHGTQDSANSFFPLEAEYKQEHARQLQRSEKTQPSLSSAERARQVREATREALRQEIKDGILPFTSDRGIPYRDYYKNVYERYHRAAIGARDKELEYLMPSPLDNHEEGRIKEAWGSDSAFARCVIRMREDGTLQGYEVAGMLQRWRAIEVDSGVSTDTQNGFLYILSNRDPQMLIKLLKGEMTAYELRQQIEASQFQQIEALRSKILSELLPHMVGEPAQNADDVKRLREGWERILARKFPDSKLNLSFGLLDLPDQNEIYRMRPADMRNALRGEFEPSKVKIEVDGEERSLSHKSAYFLLRAIRPEHEVTRVQYMEKRLANIKQNGFETYGDGNKVGEGLMADTIEVIEMMGPETRFNFFNGQKVRNDMLYLLFPDGETTHQYQPGVVKAHELQWDAVKFMLPTAPTLEALDTSSLAHQLYFLKCRAVPDMSPEQMETSLRAGIEQFRANLKSQRPQLDAYWESLLDKVAVGTRNRLRDMEDARPFAADILKHCLFELNIYTSLDVGQLNRQIQASMDRVVDALENQAIKAAKDKANPARTNPPVAEAVRAGLEQFYEILERQRPELRTLLQDLRRELDQYVDSKLRLNDPNLSAVSILKSCIPNQQQIDDLIWPTALNTLHVALKAVIDIDARNILPNVIPAPPEKNPYKSSLPDSHFATLRELVHGRFKVKNPADAAGAFIPGIDSENSLPVSLGPEKMGAGYLGGGKWSKWVYTLLFGLGKSRKSFVVVDLPSGERSTLAKTVRGYLGKRADIELLVVSRSHRGRRLNPLDAIPTYNPFLLEQKRKELATIQKKLLQEKDRLSPGSLKNLQEQKARLTPEVVSLEAHQEYTKEGAGDLARFWAREALPTDTWDHHDNNVKPVVEQILAWTIHHLRIVHPTAPFYAFGDILENAAEILPMEAKKSSQELQSQMQLILANDRKKLEAAYSLLKLSVASLKHADIRAMTAVSDTKIEYIPGRLDPDKPSQFKKGEKRI